MAFEDLTTKHAQVWSAAPFERIAEVITEMHVNLVERLAPQPGEHWLDLGCGTGDVAFHAARAGAIVTGSDHDPDRGEGAQAPTEGRGPLARALPAGVRADAERRRARGVGSLGFTARAATGGRACSAGARRVVLGSCELPRRPATGRPRTVRPCNNRATVLPPTGEMPPKPRWMAGRPACLNRRRSRALSCAWPLAPPRSHECPNSRAAQSGQSGCGSSITRAASAIAAIGGRNTGT